MLIYLVPAGGIDQIGQCHKDTDAINQSDAQKRQLYMNRIDETGGQGTDHTAKGFCGIVKAHNQIFLAGDCLGSDHVLQHRNADGITCVDQNAVKNIQPDSGAEQGACGRQGAHSHQHHHGFPVVRLVDDPDAQGGIEHERNHADNGLDDAVIGGGQIQLIFQIVVKGLIKTGVGEIDEDIQREQQQKAGVQEIFAVKEGLKGIGAF